MKYIDGDRNGWTFGEHYRRYPWCHFRAVPEPRCQRWITAYVEDKYPYEITTRRCRRTTAGVLYEFCTSHGGPVRPITPLLPADYGVPDELRLTVTRHHPLWWEARHGQWDGDQPARVESVEGIRKLVDKAYGGRLVLPDDKGTI